MFLGVLFEYPITPVPRVASTATWACARARGAGLSRTHQHTATIPLKGLRDPEEMDMEYIGGEGGQGRVPETGKAAARTAGPSGAGERGAIMKRLSQRRESKGTRSVYGERVN